MERSTFLVATHLFLMKWNEILLYLRKGWSQEWMYNLIAWHLDWWEDPRDATIREAKEEAGIDIEKNDLKFERVSYSPAWNWKEYIQFYFSCHKWKWEIKNLELDRCYKMEFYPINNLPENITPYVKEAIKDFEENVPYNEY